jgi:hypothetical protein
MAEAHSLEPLDRTTTPDGWNSITPALDVSPHGSDLLQPEDAQSTDHESEDSDDEDFDVKPRLPYVEGFTFTAMRHEPPQPFGRGYNTTYPPVQEGWKELSQTEYCFSRSLLQGQTYYEDTKALRITSTIRTGYDCGAQLVIVNEGLVAKIYDPLYYAADNDYNPAIDIVVEADSDYSREAVAYTALRESKEAAQVIPKYYGSWNLKIDTSIRRNGRLDKRERIVRLILLERLHGVCMRDIEPYYLQKKVRSLILKKALDAESQVLGAGVYHGDFSPRNIMVLGTDYDDPTVDPKCVSVQVKIFDFNRAKVIDHPNFDNPRRRENLRDLREKWFPRVASPIVRFFQSMVQFSWKGWCSNKDGKPDLWLWRNFHSDGRYIPVDWDPKNPSRRPEHKKWEPAGGECTSNGDATSALTS